MLRQTKDNYYYNHEFLGCTASLQRDQFSLTCEVKRNKKGVEKYEENFYVNGTPLYKVINKGKFPTETGLLERKMYYYRQLFKREGGQ